MQLIDLSAANHFFNEFVEAFATFDGTVVAERYLQPFMAVDSDGNSTLLQTRAEIADYFQTFLDEYRAAGNKSCRFRDLDVVAVGTNSALMTVTWDLLRADGTLSQSWRESYIVVRRESGLFVSTSVDHAS